MAVKLHRCQSMWLKFAGHPCWRVQKALNDAGIAYEVVPGPLARKKRDKLADLSGQRLYPVLELADGTVYRDSSKKMAAKIAAGKLESENPSKADNGG